MALDLIPAIDILGGKVVRLTKGAYDQVTEYRDDPLEQALEFKAQGATRLHMVDLDAARSGEATNSEPIGRVVEQSGLAVQVGGGVRSEAIADAWFDRGVERVVVGTMAVRDADATERLCANYGGRVVVAVDGRDGKVAVAGWREQSDVSVQALSKRAQEWGAGAVLFTDIARDGTSDGPSVAQTKALQESLQIDVIASGGIGTLAHVLELHHAGLRQAVCGRALYEGAFSLREALEALS